VLLTVTVILLYTIVLHASSTLSFSYSNHSWANDAPPPPRGGGGYKERMLTNKKLPASSNHYVVSMSYILLYTTYKCYCIPVCDPKK